jgi:2-haloacid dehalogenase
MLMAMPGYKPEWLTFDCYGTLIQWDEGLLAAVKDILSKQTGSTVDAQALIHTYDKFEHELEQQRPYRSFRSIAGQSLQLAMQQLGLMFSPADVEVLTARISMMPPFPEVPQALSELKRQGFRLCIISNTDDDIIAGNVAQLGGYIDRVITAQQAQAYKPSFKIFEHAHRELGVSVHDIVHVCASPHLDLAAARDMGFRCIWIDRGTGRKPLPDYTPNAVFSTLDRVPPYFGALGWV